VLLLVLVLENSAYLAVRVMEQINCRRIGLLFGAEVPQIEHEHDDEHEHDFGSLALPAIRRCTSKSREHAGRAGARPYQGEKVFTFLRSR
ncbi:MAG: hypothetical protein JO251_19880, partial [Verrucomicrobia bacterium]|nr:hypothetical protein [Verrucomicrobiota bacterium]